MTVTIDVTQDDIDTGIQGMCRFCPVATAGTRAFGQYVTVTPRALLLGIDPGKPYEVFPLPEAAVEFITLFDVGLPVKPFTFEVTNRRE